MSSLFQNLPVLVILFVIFQVVRAIKKAQQANKDYKAGDSESDEQRRVREIQERIRRIAAERRGQVAPPSAPPAPARVQPAEPARRPVIFMPETVAPLDPFGGPQKREWREREAAEPPEESFPAPTPAADTSVTQEMERQRRLTEEMRVLQERHATVKRRAAYAADQKAGVAQSEPALRVGARARLLDDLLETETVRRAFVLREVLGPPVGLR